MDTFTCHCPLTLQHRLLTLALQSHMRSPEIFYDHYLECKLYTEALGLPQTAATILYTNVQYEFPFTGKDLNIPA